MPDVRNANTQRERARRETPTHILSRKSRRCSQCCQEPPACLLQRPASQGYGVRKSADSPGRTMIRQRTADSVRFASSDRSGARMYNRRRRVEVALRFPSSPHLRGSSQTFGRKRESAGGVYFRGHAESQGARSGYVREVLHQACPRREWHEMALVASIPPRSRHQSAPARHG